MNYTLTDNSGCNLCCGTGWSALLDDLEDAFLSPFGSVGGDDSAAMHIYGIVDASVPSCWAPNSGGWWCCGGCGRSGSVAAGKVDPANTAAAGETMAHEIGHSLGRPHTCSAPCRDEGDCVDQHPLASLGVYGVDLENPAAPVYLDPDAHHDIMSYCPPKWMSDITYAALREAFRPTAFETRRVFGNSSGPETEYLVASGAIANGVATITRPFYRAMLPAGANDAQGQGPYVLELQDVSGVPLFTRYFDTMADTFGSPEGKNHFRQILPWQTGTARIVIRQGQTVLHTVLVSAHAPQVTLLSPNGEENWPPYGEHTVAWTGSDADGDPLRYILQYSADGGATWQAIAVNLTGTSYILDAGRLPGSQQALLRVIATDGVNTSHDDSDGVFAVEGKPPTALILYTTDRQRVLPGQPVILEGSGTDLEDGPLTDGLRFTWRSSLEGDLGVGRRLYFDDLLTGWHVITLTVADTDGYVGQSSVSIFVGQKSYLPLLLR